MDGRIAGKTVTAADVARAAGVSRSMVSRAFRENAYVSSEQREKILKTANALGYSPNVMAQALISGKTPFVGVVTSGLANPIHAELYGALVQEMQARSLVPLSFQMVTGGADKDDLTSALETIKRFEVRQIVLTSFAVSDRVLDACLETGLRVHLLNRADDQGRTGAVCADVAQGGVLAARHAIETGRRRIAILDGAPGAWTARQRRAGYEQGLANAGQSPVAILPGDYTERCGFVAAADIAAMTPRPDAVLCANDLSACGMITGLRANGLRVPEDVAVIGFDDIPQAAWSSFHLTTVSLPVRPMVSQLCDRLADDTPPDIDPVTLLPCSLKKRTSGG
ncbi:LacI family DNA-binding transcriptional regulator [Marivita sp. S0852]|uniref:LacI family DNA-binding transcriptional regulator n=1 Tax=Marivita sp. S0852 TaxID=3373893 RepID=UPI003981C1A1